MESGLAILARAAKEQEERHAVLRDARPSLISYQGKTFAIPDAVCDITLRTDGAILDAATGEPLEAIE